MNDTSISRRTFLAGAALLGAALAVETAAAAASPGRASAVRVRFHGTGFQPMTAVLRRGQTLWIDSLAAQPLQLLSAPSAPQRIARYIGAGRAAALRLEVPGLYLLYDALSTRFDPAVQQVAARPGSRHFPLPAYAAVLVTDPDGGGVPLTGANVNIPDTSMTFQPWALVCRAGTAVRFTNSDMDAHVVVPVPVLGRGESAPFAALPLPAHGGSGTIRLERPGLYHYYCPLHARYRPKEYTLEPLRQFAGFPFVMDGLVAVVPPAPV